MNTAITIGAWAVGLGFAIWLSVLAWNVFTWAAWCLRKGRGL